MTGRQDEDRNPDTSQSVHARQGIKDKLKKTLGGQPFDQLVKPLKTKQPEHMTLTSMTWTKNLKAGKFNVDCSPS